MIEHHMRLSREVKISASVHLDTSGEPYVAAIQMLDVELTRGKLFDHLSRLVLDDPHMWVVLNEALASVTSRAA